MSNILKYILIILIIIFLGISAYLGYLYSVESKKSESITLTSEKKTLAGQILYGSVVNPGTANCASQYYLVSGGRTIWLVTDPGVFVSPVFSYSEAEVTGFDDSENNPCNNPGAIDCGCEDYLVVDEIKVITEGKSLGREYVGEITCVEGINEGQEGVCKNDYFGLYMGEETTYELALGEGMGMENYREKDRVKVFGVLSEGASTLGLDGVIKIFEISRVE